MLSNSLLVKDFMTQDPICITTDMNILQATSLLVNNKISGAPVLNEMHMLVGILTERDCIKAATHAGYFNDVGDPVTHYMSKDVEVVSVDDHLLDVATKFINSQYRRFPVIDRDRLVGLISRRSVLQALEMTAKSF